MGATRIGLEARKRPSGNLGMDLGADNRGRRRLKLPESMRAVRKHRQETGEMLGDGEPAGKAGDLSGSVTPRAGAQGTACSVVFRGAQTLSCMVIVCINAPR